jgi:hypothetical protein
MLLSLQVPHRDRQSHQPVTVPGQNVVIVTFGGGGVVLDDGNEIFAIEDAGDRDKRVSAGQVGDESKRGVAEVGDGDVGFS